MQISGQPTGDLTYSDVFLIPRRSAVGSRFAVDLAPGDEQVTLELRLE